MNAKQRVSAPRRSRLAVSTACCGRGARFAIAKDARRGDHGYQRPGIRGISDNMKALILRFPSEGLREKVVRLGYSPSIGSAGATQMNRPDSWHRT
jgi:hypothetical protein